MIIEGANNIFYWTVWIQRVAEATPWMYPLLNPIMYVSLGYMCNSSKFGPQKWSNETNFYFLKLMFKSTFNHKFFKKIIIYSPKIWSKPTLWIFSKTFISIFWYRVIVSHKQRALSKQTIRIKKWETLTSAILQKITMHKYEIT